jgi:hypothetical protein
MKPEHPIWRAACALALLAVVPALHAAENDPVRDAGWAAMKDCARLEAERARHECVDKVFRDTGLLTPELLARQEQRAFGLPPAGQRPVPPPPDPQPAVAVDARSKPAPAAASDRVEVQIAAVSRSGDGRLTITTSEGAVWRQAENLENPRLPGIGERMTIRKGSLGSYLCTLPSKLSWRCTRSR